MAISVKVVYRADSATGAQYWSNTHECDGGITDLLVNYPLVAQAFEEAFVVALLPNFWLDHIVVGTWVEDGQPYNPDTLHVRPVNRRGERSGGSDNALPLTNVLHINRLAATGRLGRVFLRGYLTEADIVSDGNGGVSLVNQAAINDYFAQVYQILVDGLGTAAPMVMVGSGGSVRAVTGLSVKGIAAKGLRNTRKSRTLANAVGRLSNAIVDGVFDVTDGIDIGDIRAVLGGLGVATPLLP